MTSIATMDVSDNASDYGSFGSDEEEIELLDQLLSQTADQQNVALTIIDIEDYEAPQGILLPAHLQPELEPEIEILRDIEVADLDKTRRSVSREPTPAEATEPDDRSPIQRFRTPPKKALSVTDLVSPSWCELQYFYVLSKHGRKKRTPAMKQGSAVHQALEDEVHITVPIETTKIEDSWGLRFWNICQGLKTLRDTGRTRELEIWGTIGGELVNGIIDELSYECPDPKHEENLKKKGVPIVDLPEYQTSITEYLLSKPDRDDVRKTVKEGERWIYLTDVKTRATPTLPTGSSLRPTIVQLHLYHHMLENLIQRNFPLERLTERYNLDPHETFSDSFLAQLGGLNQEVLSRSSSQPDDLGTLASSQDSMDVLLQHNTLATLWEYMLDQFHETFFLSEQPQTETIDSQNSFPQASQQSTSDLPSPPSQPTRLSPILTASYMSSNYKHSPGKSANRILGYKSFEFNPLFLRSYLSEALLWWRGERNAKGVSLQEAWKCRSCEFRNECEWILERDQATFNEAMERKKMREMAGVQGKNAAPALSRSKV